MTTPLPAATTPAVTLPAVPSSLSVEPGDQVNTVQWSAVPTATSYTLYWSDKSPLTKATATAIPNAVSTLQAHRADERQAALLRGRGEELGGRERALIGDRRNAGGTGPRGADVGERLGGQRGGGTGMVACIRRGLLQRLLVESGRRGCQARQA